MRILLRHRRIIQLLVVIFIIAGSILFFNPALQKLFGKLAWLLLLGILLLSPVAEISQSKILRSLMIFRREAGILMGVFALWHSLLFFKKQGLSFLLVLNKNFWWAENTISALGWGAAAVALVIILMATSNNVSMRFLKNGWKKLHQLVYIVLILVVIHVTFIGKGLSLSAAIIALFYAAIKISAVLGLKLPDVNSGNAVRLVV